jgi:hypothetical protein
MWGCSGGQGGGVQGGGDTVTPPPPVVAGSGCSDVAPALQSADALPLQACTQAALVTAIANTPNGRVSVPSACSASPIVLSSPVEIDKDITIEGNGVTLSGNDTTGLFEINRDAAASRGYYFSLQDATLTHGRTATNGGGAVRGAQFGNMTFINVVFSDNTATATGGEDGGGAIFKDEGGRLTVFNSTFTNNTATNGGAIKSLLSNVQVVNSTFDGNVARGGNNGGGAVIVDGLAQAAPVPINSGGYAPNGYTPDSYDKARFCGVLFKGNGVGGQYDANGTGRLGGALFTHTYTQSGVSPGTGVQLQPGASAIEVERSIFDANTAYDGGGALRLGGDGGGVFAQIKSSMFTHNRGGNHGGAIRMSSANADFINLTVADNCANVGGDVADCSATSASGGIGGGIVAFENQYNLDRVTLLRNRSASYGGATSQNTGVSITGSLARSLIVSNTAGNPYNLAQNCAGPSFSNGVSSWQWPERANPADPNDLGCGGANTADPGLDSTPTVCSTVAGSGAAGKSAPISVFLPSATGPVGRVAGVPVAGAICPDSLQ